MTGGRITIDGKDVRTLTLKSLRSHIGVVQQDVYLFSGTIRDNIAYGKPDASDEEIIDAAKRANIHDFISELPDGYSTYVGERGTRLSGGQKQRISIARVFLKNPPILILDEATSALDNESERRIQKVSKNFLKTEQRSQSHTASLQSKTPMKSSSSQKMALPSAELTDHCLIKTDFTLTITALDLFTFRIIKKMYAAENRLHTFIFSSNIHILPFPFLISA